MNAERFNLTTVPPGTPSRDSWPILELVRTTAEYLGKKGIRDARLNAELLLAETLNLKRLDLYLQFERVVRPDELEEFRSRVKRRARREPLQYIAGHADFRELRLRVDRRVLIPRPETELLVGEVLAWAAGKTEVDVLDVGTGSGAIALSLAREGDFRRIVGVDISADALEVADRNRADLVPDAPVELLRGSLFDAVRGDAFDVVVSNPPYVGEMERDSLDAEVRDWEPDIALFSGATGLSVIELLIRHAPDHLNPGGLLAIEIGATQADEVTGLIRKTGRYDEVRVCRDLAGRDRIALAVRD